MKSLFEAVREECSSAAWSQGVQLVRSDAVSIASRAPEEIELRVTDPRSAVSPLVVLYPNDDDWSCECRSNEDVCRHVAAAVIAARRANEQGRSLADQHSRMTHLKYELSRSNAALAFRRLVASDEGQIPLTTSIAMLKKNAPMGKPILATEQDLDIENAAGIRQSGVLPRGLTSRLLESLRECDRVSFEGKAIQIGGPRSGMVTLVEDHPDGFWVIIKQDEAIDEIFSNGALRCANTLHPLREMNITGGLLQALRKGRIYRPAEVPALVTELLPHLEKAMGTRITTNQLPKIGRASARISLEVTREREDLQVFATLIYGDPPQARIDGDILVHLAGELPMRNRQAERHLITRLREELELTPGIRSTYTGADALEMSQRLRRWDDTIEGNGHDSFFLSGKLLPNLGSSGFNLTFNSSGQTPDGRPFTGSSPAERVLKAWRQGDHVAPLGDEGWAPIPTDWLHKHGERIADLLAAKALYGELPRSTLPDLGRLCDALEHPRPPEVEELETLIEDFSGIPQLELPETLNATLRSYQHTGVDWLAFLRDSRFGALLADDMGLGKTLQALTIINGRTLVVAPTSVLYNWQSELERFRPDLSFSTYHGPTRSLSQDTDVVLTTYAILRLDIEQLSAETWPIVILDESQAIKNPDSQVARSAYRLKAGFRLNLSGTPIENRLDELWSQFHFLNPGLLAGRSDFEKRYSKPINGGEEQVAAHLHQRIRPFMLRRLKKEVATELPPRTDVVLYCELTDSERDIYESIHAATKREVVEKIETGGNVLAALEALLRLRQAACHSALIPGQEATSSSKVSLLLETLEEAIAEDHKSLVFSQWTSLLDRVEPHLDAAGVDYVRLDGSTRDRKGVVETFQDPAGPPVMLISLKAGGTGLNLTAADHVFLLDPWWNPAVEDQAADRAHRIGQERPVIVHRLVAKSTVEEGILALQRQKRELANLAMAGSDKASHITRKDLMALLD